MKLGSQAKIRVDRHYKLVTACRAGAKEACIILQANSPSYKPDNFPAQEESRRIPMYKRTGFAEGGLMEDSSRLWRMESQYPEFQKGISSRVTKEQVPTTPVEEQFMYSPTQQGYAEGGSVYDETGSMLAPEVPLDFQDGMPGDMPMDMPGGMPMDEGTGELLTPEETEVFSQALSDYPELEPILAKIGSALVEESMGESMGESMEAPMEGAVEGPGTGTSDSINAKLSDGEFVFTAKAVKQLGVDKLRKMMSKAEVDFDESSDKQTFAQMSDEGFAAGGLINRPVYS